MKCKRLAGWRALVWAGEIHFTIRFWKRWSSWTDINTWLYECPSHVTLVLNGFHSLTSWWLQDCSRFSCEPVSLIPGCSDNTGLWVTHDIISEVLLMQCSADCWPEGLRLDSVEMIQTTNTDCRAGSWACAQQEAVRWDVREDQQQVTNRGWSWDGSQSTHCNCMYWGSYDCWPTPKTGELTGADIVVFLTVLMAVGMKMSARWLVHHIRSETTWVFTQEVNLFDGSVQNLVPTLSPRPHITMTVVMCSWMLVTHFGSGWNFPQFLTFTLFYFSAKHFHCEIFNHQPGTNCCTDIHRSIFLFALKIVMSGYVLYIMLELYTTEYEKEKITETHFQNLLYKNVILENLAVSICLLLNKVCSFLQKCINYKNDIFD